MDFQSSAKRFVIRIHFLPLKIPALWGVWSQPFKFNSTPKEDIRNIPFPPSLIIFICWLWLISVNRKLSYWQYLNISRKLNKTTHKHKQKLKLKLKLKQRQSGRAQLLKNYNVFYYTEEEGGGNDGLVEALPLCWQINKSNRRLAYLK